jgi:uncharacterized membrane protein
MFNLFKPKPLLSPADNATVVAAIQAAEKQTCGEIRVYVESKCEYLDATDRAIEIFYNLKMDATNLRNGVIIYVAITDRQFAIYGDEGIYKKLSPNFWQTEVKKAIEVFKQNNIAQGLCGAIQAIGNALTTHFPYNSTTDKNELPDEIVFGK